jgi:hypothetical protein
MCQYLTTCPQSRLYTARVRSLGRALLIPLALREALSSAVVSAPAKSLFSCFPPWCRLLSWTLSKVASSVRSLRVAPQVLSPPGLGTLISHPFGTLVIASLDITRAFGHANLWEGVYKPPCLFYNCHNSPSKLSLSTLLQLPTLDTCLSSPSLPERLPLPWLTPRPIHGRS